MSEQRYLDLIAAARQEFPKFRMVRKDRSAFQRAIHHGLCIITFGRMRTYLTSYQTTIGCTIYVTSDWEQRSARKRYVTVQHELVHMRQFKRYTLVGMSLLYLLVPLPMGLAYFRMRFERAAYTESIRHGAEVYGLDHVRTGTFRERIVNQFLGPSYGWMWPFRRSIEAWYDRVVSQLEDIVDTGTDQHAEPER